MNPHPATTQLLRSIVALATIAAAVLVSTMPSAHAATVVTKDGRILVGAIVEGDAERGVKIELLNGDTVSLDAADIVRIDPRDTPEEQYARRRRALENGDAEGHFRLGRWCMDHGLREQALFEWRMAILHDPDHAEARQALGYRRDGERWVDEETYLTERGYVYYMGAWVKKEIAARREAERLEAERAADWVRTVNRLVRQIESGDAGDRELAVAQFSRLKDPAALESALRHSRASNADVRRAVVRLILENRLESHYYELLNAAVKDDDAGVRREAARALARVADRRTIQKLIGFMRSSVESMRRNAIVSALDIEDANVFAELLKHLDDDDETIRLAVLEGVRRAGYRKAAGDVQEMMLDDKSQDVRTAAARVLAALHRPGDSLETLTDALDDRSETVRNRAAEGLMAVGDPAAIPFLIKGLYVTAPRPGGDRTPVIGDQRHLIDPVEVNLLLGYRVNEAALVALVDVAGLSFDYSKQKWTKWWRVKGKELMEDYAREKAKE